MIIELGFDPVKDYNARVVADGGTLIASRANDLYRDTRSITEPSLICSFDAYKAGVLYGLVSGNNPITLHAQRVDADSGTFADRGRSSVVYYDVSAVALPSLLCSCDAGKATVLYSTLPRTRVEVSALAEASATGFSDVLYEFSGIPRIVATRNSTGTGITVSHIGTPAHPNFRLYRAGDHRSVFSVESNSTALPYTDEGLDPSLNYKYKATFVSSGTKDGAPYVEESQSSRPAYTVGSKRI
jgi:hypothetical protein